MAPDTLPGDTFADQAIEVTQYAQEAMNRIAAQYRFAGLIAGVKGPNDTDEDVDNARTKLLEAISEFFHREQTPIRQEIDRLHNEFRAEQRSLDQDLIRNPNYMQVMSLNDFLLGGGHPSDQGPGSMEFLSGADADGGFQDRLLGAGLDAATNARLTAQRARTKQIAALEVQRRAQAVQDFKNFWSGLWGSVKSYYDDKMALVAEGKYLVAAGKIVVDGVEVFHADIAIAIITAGVIAVTGGVTAAMAPLIASAVAAALRVVKVGAGVLQRSANSMRQGIAGARFAIELRKVDVDALDMPVARPEPIYSHEVDVSRDLTPDERRLLNEENQGSTEATDDAGDSGDVTASKRRQRDEDYDSITSTLTADELQAARSAGDSPRQLQARTKLINAYEAKFGSSNLDGMDIDEPMELVKYPPPDKIVTWQNELAYRTEADADGPAGSPYPFGNFFDPNPSANVSPDELGINSFGRERIEIDVSDRPGIAFRGTGDEITDTWTVQSIDPNSTAGNRPTSGGVIQWHVANFYKPHPSDSDVTVANWRDLPGNKHWVEAEEAGRIDFESYAGSNGRHSWYLYGDTPAEADGPR